MRGLRRYPAGALLVGVALVVTMAASANGATRASLPKMETGVLASVADGDTIRLRDGRRVRLVQIDAPEVGSGDCYSRASATVLRGLLPAGSTVRLEADPRLDKVDRYGRLLRYVWRGSVHTNVALVRTGAAAPWFYGGVKGKYASQFVSAANAARSGRAGLWKACPGTVLDFTKAIATRQGKPAAPLLPPVAVRTPTPSPAPLPIVSPPPAPAAQCADTIDNDGDGKIDYPADPGCSSAADTDETDSALPPAAQCADTIDNDGDGKIDYPADPGCSSAADTDETDPAPPPSNCSASYPDFCIPPPPPDKDCGDFSQKNFTVRWDVPNPDPHRLDGNKDGRSCGS